MANSWDILRWEWENSDRKTGEVEISCKLLNNLRVVFGKKSLFFGKFCVSPFKIKK